LRNTFGALAADVRSPEAAPLTPFAILGHWWGMATQDPAQQTVEFNYSTYEKYYGKPLVNLRYDLIYRQHRIADLLAQHAIDPSAPGFAAFEYGFGAGHLLRVVQHASKVTALEFSPSAVAAGRRLAPAGHPCWQVDEHADASALPLPSDSQDLVTASHVLEHLANDEEVLDEFIRIVKPGGHLLIILPAHERLFPGTKHLRVYDVAEFTQRLEDRGLTRVAVDRHQRFDRPWKHYKVILQSRKNKLWKALIEGSKAALFLPSLAVSWRALAGVDTLLSRFGAKSTSVAYLFRKG
jgi:ubiquinone/menaquinone biosynthesis C-methylase UbiE